MVQEGAMVKLYSNRDGDAKEDQLIAVINTETGFAVIERSAKT